MSESMPKTFRTEMRVSGAPATADGVSVGDGGWLDFHRSSTPVAAAAGK